MQGTRVDPGVLTEKGQQELRRRLSDWFDDDLHRAVSLAEGVQSQKFDYVRELNKQNISVVVLFHCRVGLHNNSFARKLIVPQQGLDRTGEAVAAYRMTVLNYTLEEAIDENYADVHRWSQPDKVLQLNCWSV